MKKLAFTLLFALVALSNSNAQLVKKEYSEIGDFNKLRVDYFYDVTLKVQKGTKCSISIEADQNIFDYLKIYKDQDTLIMSTNGSTGMDLTSIFKRGSRTIKVNVTMPYVDAIRLGGDSNLNVIGTVGNTDLDVSLYGKSKLSNLVVDVDRLYFYTSGVTSSKITGEAEEVDVKMDGVSSAELAVECDTKYKIIIKGTSKLIARSVDCQDIYVECKGSSNVRLFGEADNAVVDLNGVVVLDAADLVVEDMDIKCFGTNKVKVNVENVLDANVNKVSMVKCVSTPKKVNNLGNGVVKTGSKKDK